MSSEDIELTEPLLSLGSQEEAPPPAESSSSSNFRPPSLHPSLRYTSQVYLVSVTLIVFLFTFVTYVRSILPSPLPASVTNTTGEFSGQHAWDAYLARFATRPHPGNSKQIRVVRSFIADTLLELKREAASVGVNVELELQDPVDFINGAGWFSSSIFYYQSTNILAKVVGQSNQTEALLVSAHYDSVPTSHGVTDNGIGLSVAIEILRTLIYNPVKHTVIFNLNNFEENGLYGAEGFLHHHWSKDVRAFVNLVYPFLEGAGAGGRAVLFRASNFPLVKLYSTGSPTPHANVLGNDVFNLGVIQSDTDYSVYNWNDLPGLDIAFYSKRSYYHSTRDTLDSASPHSVQHMGGVALTAVRNIADSDLLIDETQQHFGASVYYDVLGIWMVTYSFQAYQWSNVLVLVLVATGAAYLAVRRDYRGLTSVRRVAKKVAWNCIPVAEGLVIVTASLVASVGVAGTLAVLLTKINPLVSYGHAYLCFLLTYVSSILGVILVQWFFFFISHRIHHHLDLIRATRHGLLVFWWIVLLQATLLARNNHIGGLYWAVWYVLSAVAGVLVAETVRREGQEARRMVWIAQLLAQILVPLVLLLDVLSFVIDGLMQTQADGSPEIVAYGFCILFSVLITFPFIPTIHRAGNYKHVSFIVATVLLILFITLSTVFPYNSIHSPNKVFFQQQYNIANGTSEVGLGAITDLDSIMRAALDPSEYDTRQCDRFPESKSGPFTLCQWPSARTPTYFQGDAGKEELTVEVLSRDSDVANSTFTVTIRIVSHSSVMCSVDFGGYALAWFGNATKKYGAIGVTSIRREFGVPWEVTLQYSEVEGEYEIGRKIRVSCHYDEWDEGQLPAFVVIKDRLPQWASLCYHKMATAWKDVEL